MKLTPDRTLLYLLAAVFVAYATRVSAAGEISFEKDVRPILKTHCFHCHGEGEQPEGGLDLRLKRFIAAGGDSGPAIDLKLPAQSLLLQRMHDGEMPPEEIESRPTSAEIAAIERWIAGGATTDGPEPESIGPGLYISEAERNFWAFRAVQRPLLPEIQNRDNVRNAIDYFILRRLEDNGLSISPEASKTTLVRRAYFDLTGLPPTPDEVTAFLDDASPHAYERLVDRLLASPHYGERWGRHWLDVAGYADSEGATDEDVVRKDAFKYRDYVIRSLNRNKPIDQFIVEQLAGDELVSPPYAELEDADVERLIATGFLRMAPDGTGSGEVDQGAARNQVIADTIEIVSTSLLGLTVGCAQCHHHRYDPISQEDYYQFRAVFEPALDWKKWRTPASRRISLYSNEDRQRAAEIEKEAKAIEDERDKKQQEYIDRTFEKELAKLSEEVREPIREARATPAKQRSTEQKELLKKHPSVNVTASSLYLYDRKAADDLKKYAERAKAVRDKKPVEQFVRTLTEPLDAEPSPTFVFDRGDFEQPKQQVAPQTLTVLANHSPPEIPRNDERLTTTGRRLAYARWLTSGRHPLVARVFVNRIWMHHFGRGLVETPGDFGVLGARPTHPQLLDWLADEFVRSGWDLKRLHKLMMTSAAYRQSSRVTEAGQAIDDDNRLYWRANVRRLEAETLRDAVLATSGQLWRKPYGPAAPVMADRVGQFVIGIENLNAGRPGAVIPMKGEDLRRSIYVQVRRSRPLGVLETFDLPAMSPNCTVRNSSTVSPQSLMMMNGEFIIAQANAFARRVVAQAGGDLEAQIRLAWQSAFGDQPTSDELAGAKTFLAEMTEIYETRAKAADQPAPAMAAFSSFCHALFSANEFFYID